MSKIHSPEHVREGATQVVAPAGGTGADAGGYDTASNRNIFINLVNTMRGILIERGMIVGAAGSNNHLARTSNEHPTEGATQVVAPAGGTGAAAGCYDTASNRDVCINLINQMRLALISRGLMVGAAASDNHLARAGNEHVTEGAAQVVAPAGGTGATAGGYDTAANRNICINLVNEMRTVLIQSGLMTGAA